MTNIRINLVPYNPSWHKELIYLIYSNQNYVEYWRGINKYLNYSECESIDNVFSEQEFLIVEIADDEKRIPIGIINLGTYGLGIQVGFVLLEEYQGKGIGKMCGELILEYCQNIRKAKFLTVEILSDSKVVAPFFGKSDWTQVGQIKDAFLIRNELRDILIYQKKLGD